MAWASVRGEASGASCNRSQSRARSRIHSSSIELSSSKLAKNLLFCSIVPSPLVSLTPLIHQVSFTEELNSFDEPTQPAVSMTESRTARCASCGHIEESIRHLNITLRAKKEWRRNEKPASLKMKPLENVLRVMQPLQLMQTQ